MSAIAAPPSVLGLCAAFYMLFIFVNLSRRLGNVTKMKPYYRGLYLSMALIFVAIVAHLLRATALLNPIALPEILVSDSFYFVTYYVSMALGVTISMVIVLRYWGWLFSERDR